VENYKRNMMVGHMIYSNMLIIKEPTLTEIYKHDIFNLAPINVAKNLHIWKKYMYVICKEKPKTVSY